MKAIRLAFVPQVGTTSHATASDVATAPMRLQQALAQVENLQRALASSKREAIAAQQQVAILTRTSKQFGELVIQRNVARSTSQRVSGEADFCLFKGIDPHDSPLIERLVTKRTRFGKGDVLYRVGDRFKALFAIRAGSCKTALLARDGQEQVVGYRMAGEFIGMDGISTDMHECQATALEEMNVCLLPFDQVENFSRLSDQFRHNLHKLLAEECVRAQSLMLLLGSMRADKRLAVFLLDLSQRYQAHGYSSCELLLRMTREEIGSYLGLKLETVSRALSRFQHEGMIQVQGRTVKLLDPVRMSELVDCSD